MSKVDLYSTKSKGIPIPVYHFIQRSTVNGQRSTKPEYRNLIPKYFNVIPDMSVLLAQPDMAGLIRNQLIPGQAWDDIKQHSLHPSKASILAHIKLEAIRIETLNKFQGTKL